MTNEPHSECDISVVITAHAEGRLAHRTMRSVQAAIDQGKSQGLQCEIIVVLDNPTSETLAYYKRWRETARILEVNNRDPGVNRNVGAMAARGKYVAIVDADDLFGRDWLSLAHARAEKSTLPHFIVHAEYTIYFENRQEVARHFPSDSPAFKKSRLLGGNYWTSVLFAPRRTFLQCPFLPSTLDSGFGYEDWVWIASVLAEGGEVLIAPRTCKFTRYKASGSRLSAHGASRVLMRPCKFFEPRYFSARVAGAKPQRQAELVERETPRPERSSLKDWAGRLPNMISRATEWFPPAQKALGKVYRRWVGEGIQRASLPDWLIEQWQAVGEIEPQLFPSDSTLREMNWFPWPDWPMGDEYEAICRVLAQYHGAAESPQFTHVYLLPWLKKGGADLVACNYINLVASHPGHRVLVIVTEDSDSPWKSKLSSSVAWLDFAGICLNLGWGRRQWLLAHLLIQLQPNVIHLIHSAVGSEIFVHHGLALSQYSRLFECIFCFVVDDEGKTTSFAVDQLPRSAEYLSGILSENQAIFDYLQKTFALNPAEQHVHYQPMIMQKSANTSRRRTDGTMQVLWAGRLDRQKRPDLLLEIARQCQHEPIHFHVYGSSVLSWEKSAVDFSKSANITYHGPFDGFHSLPAQDFDAFLNTSLFDGLPNILLEAIVAGLPIVTSNVGGIGELIHHNETGLLISPFDDIPQYVAALKRLLESEELRQSLIQNSRALVAERHSWENFVAAINQLPGYLLYPVSVPAVSSAHSTPANRI